VLIKFPLCSSSPLEVEVNNVLEKNCCICCSKVLQYLTNHNVEKSSKDSILIKLTAVVYVIFKMWNGVQIDGCNVAIRGNIASSVSMVNRTSVEIYMHLSPLKLCDCVFFFFWKTQFLIDTPEEEEDEKEEDNEEEEEDKLPFDPPVMNYPFDFCRTIM
jgi:hypothetical protein